MRRARVSVLSVVSMNFLSSLLIQSEIIANPDSVAMETSGLLSPCARLVRKLEQSQRRHFINKRFISTVCLKGFTFSLDPSDELALLRIVSCVARVEEPYRLISERFTSNLDQLLLRSAGQGHGWQAETQSSTRSSSCPGLASSLDSLEKCDSIEILEGFLMFLIVIVWVLGP